MSDSHIDISDRANPGADRLLARAATAETRAQRGLQVAIDDFFLAEDARLDERTRAALTELLHTLVDIVEGEIRENGARLLTGRGEVKLAAMLDSHVSVFDRLSRSGLLRDSELMGELIARARQDALAAALPMLGPDNPEHPSLINRFVQHPDRMVSSAAMAVLIAESRRRGGPDVGQRGQTDLPAELHHRLVWWVAAALRERLSDGSDASLPVLDRALCDAAQRSLAAYDEGDRLEATALRFARAIDADGNELPGLLVESLGDRRIVVFIALLAHALGISFALTRDVALDPAADRLWLALRALEVPRNAIAQIGYALCEADPRRDLESFADALDAVAAVPAAQARDALGALRLDPDYRNAVLALTRSGGAA